MHTRVRSLAALTVATILPHSLLAQSTPPIADPGSRFQRELEIYRQQTDIHAESNVPVNQRALIDYGGYFIPSYLSLDDPSHNTHILAQYDLLGYAKVNLDNAQEFFFLGRYSYLDYNPGDSFDGRGDDHQERIERLFYHFDLNSYLTAANKPTGTYDVSATFGRQLVYWGNGLVLSDSLDSALADFTAGPFTLELLAGITPKDSVDFDVSRPNFDRNTRRGFFGALLSAHVGTQRPYAYVLTQRDFNSSDEDTRGPITTRYDYNSTYFGIGSRGPLSDRLVAGIELAGETGNTLSNSFEVGPTGLVQAPQTKDDIQAFAGDIQLDYIFPDTRKTRLSAEGIYSTGDPDRYTTNATFGGNRSHTADHAFNSFGLVNTGLVFAAPVSNLVALRTGISTFPFPQGRLVNRMQVGIDGFLFGKADRNAPIDEGTREGSRYLGCEPDLFLNWQITEDVTLAVRYGIFFPGTAIADDDQTRQGFFISVAYAF